MAASIETKAQFADTPEGWAERWAAEFASAREKLKNWQEMGDKVDARFRDDRTGTDNRPGARLNLFTSNVQTLRALLYGKTPTVDVSRRFADAGDDIGRVAAEMLERHLNTDIESDMDSFAACVGMALDDRLLPGLGVVRLRYDAEFETREHPAVMGPAPMPLDMAATLDPAMLQMAQSMAPQVELAPAYTEEVKVREAVEAIYVYWKDNLWCPCRTWGEVGWWAYRAEMTREELVARFGPEGELCPLNANNDPKKDANQGTDPWQRAAVWEIWCKSGREVFWYVEGHGRILDRKPDPLGLAGFFPMARPLFANVTTSQLVPVPDYYLAQDTYLEIDSVSARIQLLEEAIRVAGVYDKTVPAIGGLVNGKAHNVLIPVENWAMFAEKGGIKGAIDWLPLDQIVAVMDKLREYRAELIQLNYQQTGMSDVMRGATQAGTTATSDSIKAKFASVRVQNRQDEFATFVTEIQRIKAEIIAKHFDAATIVDRSNVMRTPDAPMAQQAAELLKTEAQQFRVVVRPDSVSLTDYASLRNERTEMLTAFNQTIQALTPMAQMMPELKPMVLEVLAWVVAGFKGSQQLEGVMDRSIDAAKKAVQQPRPPAGPPPQIMVAQMKARGEKEKIGATLQADLVRTQAETQAEIAKQQAQAQADMAVDQNKEDARLRAEERRASVEAMNAMLGGRV